MQIVPVWNAIEAALKADALTKDAIKSYKQQILETGLNIPICLIGRVVKAPLKEQYFKDASGARPYSLRGVTTVAILGRAYSGRHHIETIALDIIQDNIATVLNKDTNRKLGGLVGNCVVTNMGDIRINDSESGDYFGFELVLEFDKTE